MSLPAFEKLTKIFNPAVLQELCLHAGPDLGTKTTQQLYENLVYKLEDLAEAYLRHGNVQAVRLLFETHPHMGEPLLSSDRYLGRNDPLHPKEFSQRERVVIEILRDAANNAYELAIFCMEQGWIAPSRLGEYLHGKSVGQESNIEQISRAVEDALKPGFLRYAAGEKALREGVYPAAPDDRLIHNLRGIQRRDIGRDGISVALISIRDILPGPPPSDILPEECHTLLNPELFGDPRFQNVDTRGLRIQDLEEMTGGASSKNFLRDTFVNDMNGAIAETCFMYAANSIRNGKLEVVRGLAQSGIVDLGIRPFPNDFSRNGGTIEFSETPEMVTLVMEFGALPDPQSLVQETSEKKLRAIFEGLSRCDPPYDWNGVRVTIGQDQLPLLAAAAHQNNKVFLKVAADYAEKISIDPNILSAQGFHAVDVCINAHRSFESSRPETMRALLNFPSMRDVRPPSERSLVLAVERQVPYAVKALSERERTGSHAHREVFKEARKKAAQKVEEVRERMPWGVGPFLRRVRGWVTGGYSQEQEAFQRAKSILNSLETKPLVPSLEAFGKGLDVAEGLRDRAKLRGRDQMP